PSVVRAPATPPAREVSSSSPEPAESDAQLTSSQPATVSIRPSPTALSQLGETVAINDRFSFRPPRDLTGRMSGGRTGQWRGSGNVQRVVGLDVSVRPADGLVDPVQVAPSGQQQLRTHDQWTTLGDAAVDRLSVGGLLVTRVR